MTTTQPGADSPINMPGALPETRFHEALDAVRAEAMQIPAGEVIPLNLEVSAAVATTLGSAPRLAKLRAAIVAQIGGFDIRNLDMLETYARGLMDAHLSVVAAAKPPEEIEALNAELTSLKDTFIADVVALEKRKLVDSSRVGLTGLKGYRNVAADVLLLCKIFANHWAAIEGKTGVQRAEVERAGILADRMMIAVGARGANPKATAAQIDIRDRAFTLFMRAHNQTLRAVTYIRWDEDDADEILPTVFTGGRRTRTEAPKPPETSPVTPVSPAAQPPAGNGTSQLVAGLPNSDPFGP